MYGFYPCLPRTPLIPGPPVKRWTQGSESHLSVSKPLEPVRIFTMRWEDLPLQADMSFQSGIDRVLSIHLSSS